MQQPRQQLCGAVAVSKLGVTSEQLKRWLELTDWRNGNLEQQSAINPSRHTWYRQRCDRAGQWQQSGGSIGAAVAFAASDGCGEIIFLVQQSTSGNDGYQKCHGNSAVELEQQQSQQLSYNFF